MHNKDSYLAIAMILFLVAIVLTVKCLDDQPLPPVTIPTKTATITQTPLPTNTPPPTRSTNTPTITPTSTNTPAATSTDTPTATLMPTITPTATPCIVKVTVNDQIEDTFWWSAWRHLDSALRWQEIKESNNGLSPYTLQYGDVYIVEC